DDEPPEPKPPPTALEAGGAAAWSQEIDGDGLALRAGVVAPAERLVPCGRAGVEELPGRVPGPALGGCGLAPARVLAARARGWRFVTLQGELLEADGTVTVGNHHAGAGILSRKSELRELREQVGDLDRRIEECERDLHDLRARVAQTDGQMES